MTQTTTPKSGQKSNLTKPSRGIHSQLISGNIVGRQLQLECCHEILDCEGDK
jgi:hypothetical protein